MILGGEGGIALVVCLDSGGDDGGFFSAGLGGGDRGAFGSAFTLKATFGTLCWLWALVNGGRLEVVCVGIGFMLTLGINGCGYTDISYGQPDAVVVNVKDVWFEMVRIWFEWRRVVSSCLSRGL